MISTTMSPGTHQNPQDIQIKQEICKTIDHDTDTLIHFLQTFLQARNEADTTLQTASVIRKYLSTRGIRTVTISRPPISQPSIASLITHSEGPSLVMSGLMPVSSTESESICCSTNTAAKTLSLHGAKDIATKAGTAAMVAAYAYLHARREFLPGTLVLAAVSDDAEGAKGGLRHLVHDDERRELFRSDCVLDASPSAKGTVETGKGFRFMAGPHSLEKAIVRVAEEVTQEEVELVSLRDRTYCEQWRSMGIPTYSFGLEDASAGGDADGDETISLDEFVALVKVFALSAWDYLRYEEVEP